MTVGLRSISALLLLGLAWGAHAEPWRDSAQNRNPARFSISFIRQTDGSVIERLDLSALGVGREEGMPATPAEWLLRIVDLIRNGEVLKRPQLLAEWLEALTEPRSMTALATVAVEPGAFPRALARLPDPAAAGDWAEFVDPEVLMRWVAAGMDPHLYQAVFQHMFDPKKYLSLAAASGHPLIAGVTATESHNRAMGAGNHAGSPATKPREGAQAWIQLPARKHVAYPWLASGTASRY